MRSRCKTTQMGMAVITLAAIWAMPVVAQESNDMWQGIDSVVFDLVEK